MVICGHFTDEKRLGSRHTKDHMMSQEEANYVQPKRGSEEPHISQIIMIINGDRLA